MAASPSEVYAQVTKAFSQSDTEVLIELIADDVIWHTDDLQPVPAEFRGRDAFFAAAAATPRENLASWEVIPQAIVEDGRTGFAHQLDRFVLTDGTLVEIHFLLHIELNERGQIREVWEFGQSRLPH
jgi:hypothetical protein